METQILQKRSAKRIDSKDYKDNIGINGDNAGDDFCGILIILKRQYADTDADGDGDYVWDNDEAQDIHDNDDVKDADDDRFNNLAS